MVRARPSRQRDGATGSGYLTSGGEEEFKSINAIATSLESDAAKAGPPRLPSDSLLGDWTLLYSSNRFTAAGGGKLLEGEQAPGGVRDIRQVITRDTFSNVVTLAPWPGVIDAFKGASVTLSLDHDYKVVSQSYPARLRISLREVRRTFSTDDESGPDSGSDWQGDNFLTKLVPKTSQYTVPAPFRRENSPLSEFDVTYLSETLRITRGTGAGQELRIFQRAPYVEEVWGMDEVYPTTD